MAGRSKTFQRQSTLLRTPKPGSRPTLPSYDRYIFLIQNLSQQRSLTDPYSWSSDKKTLTYSRATPATPLASGSVVRVYINPAGLPQNYLCSSLSARSVYLPDHNLRVQNLHRLQLFRYQGLRKESMRLVPEQLFSRPIERGYTRQPACGHRRRTAAMARHMAATCMRATSPDVSTSSAAVYRRRLCEQS